MRIDLRNYHPISPFQHFMEAAMRLSATHGDGFRNSDPVCHAVNLAWDFWRTGDRSLMRAAWSTLRRVEVAWRSGTIRGAVWDHVHH